MYNEPDWSSLTFPERIEKAIEFGNKGILWIAEYHCIS